MKSLKKMAILDAYSINAGLPKNCPLIDINKVILETTKNIKKLIFK